MKVEGPKQVAELRQKLKEALVEYGMGNGGLSDVCVLSAVSSLLCECLIAKGAEFDNDLIEVMRNTYAVMQSNMDRMGAGGQNVH